MSGQPRVTQKDVARRAGVSQATVSTILNGGRDVVAEETASRIDAAILELGYRPNRFAQALRTQRTMVIACVVPDLTNPFYPSLFAGVQQVANQADYDVVAINTGGKRASELNAALSAQQGRYDGMIGVFFSLSSDGFEGMVGNGVPLVRMESSRKSGGPMMIDDLFVDNIAAARAAVDELIALGHRDIVMIAGKGGPETVRIEGYRQALATLGVAPQVWQDSNFTDAGGRAATRRLLDSGQPMTAIFAANDLMAIGAMQELAEIGLRVPEDVSIFGFDDILAASLVTPGLSTIALDQELLGRCAADMLLDRIAGHTTGSGRAIERPFRVLRRASIGPPPS